MGWTNSDGYAGMARYIASVAQQRLPTRSPEVRKQWITSDIWQFILRGQREAGGIEPAAREAFRKEVKRAAHTDKRGWLLEGIGADRPDKYLLKALRNLKRERAPSHWERTNRNGAPVPRLGLAAEAARYLATQHWGDPTPMKRRHQERRMGHGCKGHRSGVRHSQHQHGPNGQGTHTNGQKQEPRAGHDPSKRWTGTTGND